MNSYPNDPQLDANNLGAPEDPYLLPEIVVTAQRYKPPYQSDLNISGFGENLGNFPDFRYVQPVDTGPSGIHALLAKYMPPAGNYAAEITAKRGELKSQQEQFNQMLLAAANEPANKPSKAEMYFRLAAAFADPGKTGHFMEGAGRAAGTFADYNKQIREAEAAQRAAKLKLGLESRKLDIDAAKDELTTLRTLQAEDIRTQRDIAKAMITDYITSGKPMSEAGRIARDMGRIPGTPEYYEEVIRQSNMEADRRNAQLAAIAASISGQNTQAEIALRREARQAQEARRLSPKELDLKSEAEDIISASNSALTTLNKALALNPNTFDTSLGDMAQRKALEAAGSKNQTLLNTREQENLLASQALGQLKALVGGNPTEGERAIIMDLQGIGAKSKEERELIIRHSINLVKSRLERANKRLKNIDAGRYREVGGAE